MLNLTLVMMGNKPPQWVRTAEAEFSKRLKSYVQLQCIEIPCMKRGNRSDLARIAEKECALMSAAIPEDSTLISLDVNGKMYDSEGLAHHLERLQNTTSRLCCLIGGPEGLPPALLQRSHEKWSLSPLTLPHMLARVVLLEVLYRSWSIINKHPYHK